MDPESAPKMSFRPCSCRYARAVALKCVGSDVCGTCASDDLRYDVVETAAHVAA